MNPWLYVIKIPGTVVSGLTLRQPLDPHGEWLCIYDDCQHKPGGIYYGAAILVLADDVTVEDCNLAGGAIGIAVYHANRPVLRRNIIRSVSAWGIYLNGVEAPLVEENEIYDAIRSCPQSPDGCESAGVMGLGVRYGRFLHNLASHCGDGFYFNGEGQPSNYNRLEGNTATGCPHNGYEITFSLGNELWGNTAEQGLYPFWIGGSDIGIGDDNVWKCIKSASRAVQDSVDSTPVPTVVHWLTRRERNHGDADR